jgi:hypothetical protein
MTFILRIATLVLTAVLFSACGGGDYPEPKGPDANAKSAEKGMPGRYTVSGTISGLGTLDPDAMGSLTLDFVTLDPFFANGPFTLTQKLANKQTYNVSVVSPAGYTCVVENGSGVTSRSNVTGVDVICTAIIKVALKYQVSGLPAGASVVTFFNGFPLPAATTDGVYNLAEFLPGTRVIFGVLSTVGAVCTVPTDDQVSFLAPEPNPRILQVNCSAAPG